MTQRSSARGPRHPTDPGQPIHRLSRRDFLAWSAGAALAARYLADAGPAAAQGSLNTKHKLPEVTSVPASMKGSGQVVVASWGGVGTDGQRVAFYEPFTKLTGIKVVEAVGPSAAKIRAMVEAKRVEWDVVQSSRGSVIQLMALGDYWHEIDYGMLEPTISSAFRHKFAVDMLPYAQIFAYRTDVFPKDKGPRSWKDFWDVQRFPGPRTMPTALAGNFPELVGALIADGVPPDKVYPIDVDRAFNSLSRIKPHVVKWWDTGAAPLQMLSDKEVVMAVGWNARIASIQAAGVPCEIVWDGGTLYNNAWAIPKGAPNRENALKFIGFSTYAISQARYSILLPYGFTNQKAAEYIPPDVMRELPTSPENFKKLILQDVDWWAANREAVIGRWNKWVLS
jgi:putative spermidine/putrescine transport system substrate-binding protein